MLPASTKAGGQCFAMPDVCKTPTPAGPIPIPYPNIAMVAEAKKTTKKVKFGGKPVVVKKSKIPRSSGDEPGTAGGVVSGVNMKTLKYMVGSSKVKLEGQKCEYLTAMTSHNKNNHPAGMQVAPSQTKVLIGI